MPTSRIWRDVWLPRLEALESRALLTTLFVDNNLLVTADRDASGGLSPGDQVTFGNGQTYQQIGLTYASAPIDGDAGTAFSSISQALASPLVQPGDTVDIAGGTYTDAVTIGESITLQGEGNVVINAPSAGSGIGIMIANTPDAVTLDNLDIEGFRTCLSSDGIGTLNLTGVTLGTGGPTTIFADPLNRVSNVTNLNVVDTSTDPQTVNFNLGPPMGLTPYLQTKSLALTLGNVLNLSITTSAVGDTFDAAPIAKTITITPDDSVPPGQPGNTLNMWLPSYSGNALSVTHDTSGYAGVWSFGGGATVHFSHFQTLMPGVIVQGYQSFSATEGVDSGSVLLAQFTDPFGNLPLTDYSADIDWTDGSTSSGTIRYDATTGLYSVYGDHVFGEPEGGGVLGMPDAAGAELKIVIRRQGDPDTTTYAMAIVSDAPLVGAGATLSAAAGTPLGSPSTAAAVATFSSGANDPEDASHFWNRIDWGDGAWSSGVITPTDASGEHFAVTGSHAYTSPGTYDVTVTLADGAEEIEITSTVVVSPASTPLPKTLTGTAGVPLGTQPDGEFGDLIAQLSQPGAVGSRNYTATIDWGDGTTSGSYAYLDLQLFVQNSQTYVYDVAGVHTYSAPGTYDAKVTFIENGIPEATVISAAIITPSDTAVTSQPTSTPAPAQATMPNEAFVEQVYQNFLDRLVDPASRAYWAGQLDAGMPRSQFLAEVVASAEYLRYQVNLIYIDYLHRTADPASLAFGANLLAGGMTEETLASIVVGSDEYFSLHGGTNDGFLNALFQDALNRPIDPSAKNALQFELAAGVTREQLAAIVFDSHEYHADVVSLAYLNLLNRAPDAAGRAGWSAELDTGATNQQIWAAIASSDAYFARAIRENS